MLNKTAITYGLLKDENVNDDHQEKEDALEATIGNFGKWQLRISVLMSLLKFPIAWFTLSIIFLAPPTNFWCKPSQKYSNMSDTEWLKISEKNYPRAMKQEGVNSGYCEMVDIENNPNSTIPCVYGYGYNRTIFSSTIITEWDLVCGHERLVELSQMTLMFGVLIGNIFCGIMADKKGRKTVLLWCIISQSVLGTVDSLVPWYSLFVLLRFLLGIANGGTVVTSFVMCLEVVGGKWRTVVPILYQIPFGFGISIMAGLAYFMRDWRELHLAISMISSIYFLYGWYDYFSSTRTIKRCMPESPRWLLAVGRKDEAIRILREAAIENKLNQQKFQEAVSGLPTITKTTKQKASFSALFSTRELRKRSFLLYINWTISGITFYAFSQYLGHVGSNVFLTVATSGLIAVPGALLCILLVGRAGRRATLAGSHLFTACCFLAVIAVPKGQYSHDWPRVVLAGCGITGISISMPALYLWTGELYPTVLRNAGVGTSIMFSRIGSMLAPVVVALEEFGPHVPLLILAVGACAEGLLVLPLPETKGLALPDTIEDLEDLGSLESDEKGYVTVPVRNDDGREEEAE
ncbi:unnamed protein product [Phaedon cochleariae]|uniref:Major facilitator superfamily (MFS) profile domain-containing protein n=1 Tax=Phaedon cochleariae TaxID=80249 RepID=A0A9P0GL07_PHACE|nr:unnamed protein product [Phaedon cochleariae]